MFRVENFEQISSKREELIPLNSEINPKEKMIYFTDTRGTKIISYAECEIDKINKKIIIHEIFVRPEERYKANGKKLIKFILRKLRYFKCIKIVYPYDENTQFFEKVGFKIQENQMIFDQLLLNKKRQEENNKVIVFSILGNIVLAITKIIWGLKGKSRALLSDGINSLSDVGTSTGLLIGVHYSNLPEDEEHPYGHERIESIIANSLGIVMILTSFELLRGTGTLLYQHFFKNADSYSTPEFSTVFWGIFSAAIKYLMYRYKIKIGEKTGNTALIADAKDSRNDIFSSLGAVLGIILAVYVNPIFDLFLSLPIAFFILKEGIAIIFENAEIILDKQDTEFLAEIEKYIYDNSIIKNVHDLRMRSSGNRVFLIMDIRVSGNMRVKEAHAIADSLENSIQIEFPTVKEVTIHVDPTIE